MKIVIDILHPADINFYKNAVNLLYKEGNDVDFIIRPRDNLIKIFEKEFPDAVYTIIGKHYSNLPSKISNLIKRDVMLYAYLRKKDFDVVTSFGGFYIAHAARWLRKKSVLFTDDYEYKMTFYLCKFSASNFIIMPKTIPSTGNNINKHNCLKELAYLHPNYFKPDRRVLDQFGLSPQKYIFIREEEYSSLNYKKRRMVLSQFISYIKDLGFDVIALSQDNLIKEELRDLGCIILDKPTDVHSLLSFAVLTIASGDTMARESCIVGTPTIYTGNREMYANDELINRGCMFKSFTRQDVLDKIHYIIENNVKNDVKKNISHAIRNDWEDTTEIILKELNNAANNE